MCGTAVSSTTTHGFPCCPCTWRMHCQGSVDLVAARRSLRSSAVPCHAGSHTLGYRGPGGGSTVESQAHCDQPAPTPIPRTDLGGVGPLCPSVVHMAAGSWPHLMPPEQATCNPIPHPAGSLRPNIVTLGSKPHVLLGWAVAPAPALPNSPHPTLWGLQSSPSLPEGAAIQAAWGHVHIAPPIWLPSSHTLLAPCRLELCQCAWSSLQNCKLCAFLCYNEKSAFYSNHFW